jgi:hypothetical protein
MKKHIAVAATATLAVGLSAGVTAASAADYIFWTAQGQGGQSIGRANLDGTGANENLVPGSAGVDMPDGVMANSSSVFWLNGINGKTLAKANTDGSGARMDIAGGSLGGTGVYQAALVGDFIYFPSPTQANPNGPTSTVGRIGTDGTGKTVISPEVFMGGMSFSRLAGVGSYVYPLNQGSSLARVTTSGRVDNTSFVSGISPSVKGLAASSSYLYWTATGGIGRATIDGATKQPSFVTGLTNVADGIAVSGTYIYWSAGSRPSGPFTIGRMKVDGTDQNPNFITGLTKYPSSIAVTGEGTPAPAPAPTPTPNATPAATVLTAPTQSSTADSNGNVAVSLSLQLDEVGKYTFIFEKVTSNEMSREQASGSSRISMQKGTKIGKRKLTKVITAADVTTTSAGAKLVMRALLKKAQAKNWNLRVIHAANDGTLTQSVIKK